jgi:uncharacterized protein
MDTTVTDRNRELIRTVYARMAEGDSQPFLDSLAEGVRWTITGSSAWSRTWHGNAAVRQELLRPLVAQFDGRYTARAERVIADGDLVVAEVRGRVTTRTGQPYHNAYCFIYRIEDGKISEITEYLDTALVNAVLQDPPLPRS